MKNAPLLKVHTTGYYDEVTGSRTLLVIERPDGVTYRILVDYGYFQESEYKYLNYVDELDVTTIDAIIVTHTHIDHIGLLPKAVRQGYVNKIYMTEISKCIIGDYLADSARQQEENAQEMREKFPNEAQRFHALYYMEDVERTVRLCEGIDYRKTIEILPGVKLTFWENGHILGASMVLLQCSFYNMKPMNFLFTGDFKFANNFSKVHPFPKWFRDMELIMFSESTYGTTNRADIEICFRENILKAFAKKQNILIGAFAQARFQELCYDFKCLQDEGLIPPEYQIYLDGTLGINTTFKYKSILEQYNPAKVDFLPTSVHYIEAKAREKILSDNIPKIVITTSGMLNNGPARQYVPIFLENNNALIHLVGYAAEETLARKLLESQQDDFIKVGSQIYKKRAEIKTTSEKSSHASKDELLQLIKMFSNVKFLGIVHGSTECKNVFYEDVLLECHNVQQAGILNRTQMFRFYRVGNQDDKNTRIIVKAMSAGLINSSKVFFGKELDKNEICQNRQKAKQKKESRRGCKERKKLNNRKAKTRKRICR